MRSSAGILRSIKMAHLEYLVTGTPPLTWFFGTQKNCVKEKPHCRRSILVLKHENGTFLLPKSNFWAKCSINKVTNWSNHTTFNPKKVHLQKSLIYYSGNIIWWWVEIQRKKIEKKNLRNMYGCCWLCITVLYKWGHAKKYTLCTYPYN